MKLFYATTNSSKILNMRRRLKDWPIEIVTPKDLKIYLEVEESGRNPQENAHLKAQAYYELVKIPTIAADSGLNIKGIPLEKQPGVYVRRVKGRTLSDDEMILYYANLAKSYGGILKANYVTGLSFFINGTFSETTIQEDPFLLTSEINRNSKHNGNHLDVITIDPVTEKYYNELTDLEFQRRGYTFEKECLEFIRQTLEKENYFPLNRKQTKE